MLSFKESDVKNRINQDDWVYLKIDDCKDKEKILTKKLPNNKLAKGKIIYLGINGRLETVLIIEPDHAIYEYLITPGLDFKLVKEWEENVESTE